MTATITMFNARTFLEEGRFETSAAAQVRMRTKKICPGMRRMRPGTQPPRYACADACAQVRMRTKKIPV